MNFRKWIRSKSVSLLFGSLALSACQSDRALVSPKLTHVPVRSIIGPATPDPIMAELSPIARHIVAGLQDPEVRTLIFAAMKSPQANGVGVDLADCANGTAVNLLLEAGSRRGGVPADNLCNRFKATGGMTLYMDRDRLAHWDPRVIPVVTAIANPDQPVAIAFLGYRSPDRTIQLNPGAPLDGPILVVLPFAHPSRWALRTPQPARVEPRILPPITESKIVPSLVLPPNK